MKTDLSPAESSLRRAALDYHQFPKSGKISVTPIKPLSNQRELSLAYSPGVAYPCLDIQADPLTVNDYTSRGNLVGVITNGTAVLGLGDIGPLASKPVMEGKGCLFQKFAGIDVFDIELNERDPDKLVDVIAALEPTLGGINLEDIKAPECFYIERKLRERVNIPVFHDDQHGTAIISSAALLNGLEIVGKSISEVRVAVSGAGAAAIACVDLMVELGVDKKNVFMVDSKGVIYEGRAGTLDESKRKYAQFTEARTLAEVVNGADVFLGCSTAGVLSAEMVKTMARSPIILALANPEPEIRPELAKAARPDCIIATGRSDYPNQVNNVLCFPYIFRGALDCGATKITPQMKMACVYEIANLAKAEVTDEVSIAYPDKALVFGADYLIPTPFDSRLILRVAPAVAKAAQESGVATKPISDWAAYRDSLSQYVYKSGLIMRPVFNAARTSAKRVVYAEGEDERVLRAAQIVLDEQIARPILIGRHEVIERRIRALGLRFTLGRDVDVLEISGGGTAKYSKEKIEKTIAECQLNDVAAVAGAPVNTVAAALMVSSGEADGLICGLEGRYGDHLAILKAIVGEGKHHKTYAALSGLLISQAPVFIADTYVNEMPDANQLAHIALAAVDEVKRFGIQPKVAFLSHSNFGSSISHSAGKMREAFRIFSALAPEIQAVGELHGDAALSENIRAACTLSHQCMDGAANILICPNLDSANILFNVLKVTAGNGITIGPILMGCNAAAHILTPASTVRRILNMSAVAASR